MRGGVCYRQREHALRGKERKVCVVTRERETDGSNTAGRVLGPEVWKVEGELPVR